MTAQYPHFSAPFVLFVANNILEFKPKPVGHEKHEKTQKGSDQSLATKGTEGSKAGTTESVLCFLCILWQSNAFVGSKNFCPFVFFVANPQRRLDWTCFS
jgi:hypothetical protein